MTERASGAVLGHGVDVIAVPDVGAGDAAAVLRDLAGRLAARPGMRLSAAEIERRFVERESLGSTAIGGGLAMPHCRGEEIDRPAVAIVRTRLGVPFGAEDGVPVRLFFALVTPGGAPGEHLRILAEFARRARDPRRRAALLAAPDEEAMLAAWSGEPA